MGATFIAFVAMGFFAASLLSLFQFLAVTFAAALAATIIAVMQGMSLLHGVGMGLAALALGQLGYGVGLAWAAGSRARCARD